MTGDPLALPKPYLVVLALYELGGESDLEDIAVKAFTMFPGIFTWKTYPEYPDKDVVRVHLSDAKKSKFGGLVTDKDLREEGRGAGGRTKRYALTVEGVEKAKELGRLLDGRSVTAEQTSLQFKRVVQPVLESSAFKRFTGGTPIRKIGREQFLHSFKLFADDSEFVINGRLARIGKLADALLNPDERAAIEKYIAEGRSAFDL